MLQKAPQVADVLAGETRRARTRGLLRWVIAVVVLALVAGGGWLWWSGGLRPAKPAYATAPVTRGDLKVTVVATGTLEPTGQVEVGSSVAGTVESVAVDYNDAVAKGAVLARLDTTDLVNRIDRSTATVDSQTGNRAAAQASLDDANAALKRANALSKTQSISTRDLELAESAVRRSDAALKTAEAQLKVAQADLQGARNDYRKACICSPIDGIVLEVNATQGQTLTAAALAQPMFKIAEDLHTLDLEVDVDEADVGMVKTGQHATFTVPSWPDRVFEAEIRQVRFAPVNADGVVSYKAVLRVSNPKLELRPGMSATSEIVVATASGVLLVPNPALHFTPATAAPNSPPSSTGQETGTAKPGVWLQTEEAPRRVDVTTGLTDGQLTEITSGDLKAGDVVITGIALPK